VLFRNPHFLEQGRTSSSPAYFQQVTASRHLSLLKQRSHNVEGRLGSLYVPPGGGVSATDPTSAGPDRINACFAIRAFAGVRTVCRQSRGNPWRNAVGKVAAHPANARQTSLTNTSTHLGDETQSKGESAQRSGRNVVEQRKLEHFRNCYRPILFVIP
jgi:hypothetical protein